MREKEYYPIAIGNSWNYEVIELKISDLDTTRSIIDSLKVDVVDTAKLVTGEQAWRVESEGKNPFERYTGSNFAYLYKTPDYLTAYENLSGGEWVLLALFPLEEGRKWVYWADEDDTVWAEVQAQEDVEVKDETFSDCFRIEYLPSWSKYWKHIIWMAPGIGPVKYEYYDGLGTENLTIQRWEIFDYKIH